VAALHSPAPPHHALTGDTNLPITACIAPCYEPDNPHPSPPRHILTDERTNLAPSTCATRSGTSTTTPANRTGEPARYPRTRRRPTTPTVRRCPRLIHPGLSGRLQGSRGGSASTGGDELEELAVAEWVARLAPPLRTASAGRTAGVRQPLGEETFTPRGRARPLDEWAGRARATVRGPLWVLRQYPRSLRNCLVY